VIHPAQGVQKRITTQKIQSQVTGASTTNTENKKVKTRRLHTDTHA